MKNNLIIIAYGSVMLFLAVLTGCKEEQPVDPSTTIKLTDIISEVSIDQNIGEYVDGEPPESNSNSRPVVAGANEIVHGGALILRVQLPDSAKQVFVSMRNTGSDYLTLSFGEWVPGYFVIAVEDHLKQGKAAGRSINTPGYREKNTKCKAPTRLNESCLFRYDMETCLLIITFTNNESISDFALDIASGSGNQVSEFVSHEVTVNSQASSSNMLQVSLNWADLVDMDLHVETPDGHDIYYMEPIGENGGTLDLDSNPACEYDNINNENIRWLSGEPARGIYVVRADLWSACDKDHSFPFVVSARINGRMSTFSGNFTAAEESYGAAFSGRIITRLYYYEVPGYVPAISQPYTMAC